jgi:4'-phosphopantetheinyl transferase
VIEWLASPRRPRKQPAAWLLNLADEELRQSALSIPPSEADLARAAGRPAAERKDVLVRRGLVRLCVAAALGVAAAEIGISWTAGGAPQLAPPFADLHLSWAQRQGRFVCALARAPIGVDVEIADGGEIPWNVLHPDEAALLRGAIISEREALFLRIWAAKEAYAKALGEGFRRDPSSFVVRLQGASGVIDDPALRGPGPTEIAFAPIAHIEAIAAVAMLAS